MSLGSWKGFLPDPTVIMVRRNKRLREEHPPEERAKSAPVQNIAESRDPRAVLLYLEREPSFSQKEFLLKMMASIQLMENDLCFEWGEFPESKSLIVLGIGLEKKKQSRLSALRPDAYEIPKVDEIQSDPKKKREVWEKLKRLAVHLKELR